MNTLRRTTDREWQRIATNAAWDAGENNFPSRRGLYVIEGCGIVFYDNNPFKIPREGDPRERLLASLRAVLARLGFAEKAHAYYPTEGEEKDYTFAMAIEAGEEHFYTIKAAFEAATVEFYRDLEARRSDTPTV